MFPKVMSLAPVVRSVASRSYGVSAVAFQKAKLDPVQELFLNKSREYFTKKASSKTGLVDPTPAMEKSLKDELDKVTKNYGSSASAEFPAFKFEEPVLESIEADKLDVSKL